MADRYSAIRQQPVVSSYIPLPLEGIQNMYEKQQVKADEGQSAYNVLKTDIQGGLATQLHAQELNKRKNQMLDEAYNRAQKEGDYGQLSYDVKNIANLIKSDPKYIGIQRDIAQTERVNAQRRDPMAKKAIHGYLDDYGTVKQLDPSQSFDESYYNQVNPGNTFTEYKPILDTVKPMITKEYNDPIEVTDSNGNTRMITKGQAIKEGNRSVVREMLRPYIENDENALNQPSRYYSDALSNKTQGRTLTKDEHLDEIANTFMPYLQSEEIQSLSGTSKAGKGSGSGSGSVDDPINQNEIGSILSSIFERGAGNGKLSTVAAIHNSETFDKKNNTYTRNTQDNAPVLTYGKDGDVYQAKVNDKFIGYKIAEDQIKKGMFQTLDRVAKSETDMYYTDKETGNILLNPSTGKPADTRYAQIYEKERLRIRAERDGIKLDDKKLNTDFSNYINDKTIDLLSQYKIKLNELNGNVDFSPVNNSNVTFTDDGKFATKDMIRLTKPQADAQFGTNFFTKDNVDKLVNLKLIKSQKEFIDSGDGKKEEQTVYYIPTFNESNVDVHNATKQSEINTWGASDKEESRIPSKIEYNNLQLERLQGKRKILNYSSEFDKDKKTFIEPMQNFIDKLDPKDENHKAIIDEFNNLKKDPVKNKKDLLDLRLMIENKNAYFSLYGDNSLGESKEGWVQTPAKPLQ
jgi:hypothetical protein